MFRDDINHWDFFQEKKRKKHTIICLKLASAKKKSDRITTPAYLIIKSELGGKNKKKSSN